MNTKLKKAVNDLRINPGRTALVLVALVIGLWGIGSLLVSATVLQRDLNQNFLGTIPPHVVLTSPDFSRLDLAEFRKRPDVESAEFRDLSLQRIEVRPNDWIPLWLFGVEDFSRFQLARFYVASGRGAPPEGTMWIERDGLLVSHLRLGSVAKVRAGSRNLDVPITGITFDPAQAPATQDHFIYGYVDKKTYASIAGEPANTRLILRFKNVRSKGEVQSAVDRVIQDLGASGIVITSQKVPKFLEHPHQWQLNTLLLLQGTIGFLAFVMGAVLVSQLMAAILSRQTRQIGVLKAMGASRLQVFQIYLTMLLMLSAAAGAVAIPLARASGYAFAYFVAGKLNFDILTTSLPHSVYFSLIAAALLMPIVLSLPAVLRAVRLSVYDALNDYGINRDTRGATSGARFAMPSSLALAFRNTMRKKRRLAVTVTAMAIGVAIFNTGFNVRQSLWTLLTEVRDGMRYDVQAVFTAPVPPEAALRLFRGIDNVARIEAWNGGRGELQTRIVATDNGVGIIALPHNTDLFHLRIESGRWLREAEVPEVVLNQQAMELFGNPPVGKAIVLKLAGRPVTVHLVGVVWELDKAKIYMDQRQYDALANPQHLINSLMFVASDRSYGSVLALKRSIEQALSGSDLRVLYVMSQAERVKIIYDHLNIILTTILFLALMVLIVAAIGMASATGINIMERTREIGVLRAIGATPRRIYGLFVSEGLIVSAASVLLGLLLSWPLSMLAAPFFGNLMLGNGASLRYAFSVPGFVITLASTVAFGWLASRIPARRAVRVSTREALAYE